MYQTDIQKQTITIEGITYEPNTFRKNLKFIEDSFRHDLFLFLKDWFSESPVLKVQTSGSTGVPKEMLVEKERMIQSAVLTCSFLDLQKGDSALLCMSLNYIAGKMVVVRALVAGLDLYPIAPCGNPLENTDIPFKFAAMIPMQVFNCLQNEEEREKLAKINSLIIGGGAIDKQMERVLKSFSNNIYSTYGMTETLSHIALRKLNGKDASDNYIPFSNVKLSLSKDNTLIIDAPLVARDRLYTNDVVTINRDGSFRILGRKDNIINSGGIKIQIEEVEKLLKPIINCAFAITSIPDSKFGEIIVLATEKVIDGGLIAEILPTYYIPKKIIRVDRIPLTETGKISRVELKRMVEQLVRSSSF